jgi:hypothetical protein
MTEGEMKKTKTQTEKNLTTLIDQNTAATPADFNPEDAIEEIKQSVGELFGNDELSRFLRKKAGEIKRSDEEQARLLNELNAKAFALTKDVAVKGIRVERGKGYYATISTDSFDKIDSLLQKLYHPKKYKQLENHLFVPEKIAVDHQDLESEIPEVIHGILRHEIGEVKYNNWKQFIIRQYHIEQKSIKGEMGKGWGKDYAHFINGVGDPRINNLVSKDSPEARKDIIFAELSGVLGLIDLLPGLPRHVQFLLLANCRDAEDYAPGIVELLLRQADSMAVHYYQKHKQLLAEISQAADIKDFYKLANQLWSEYAKSIVDRERREIDDYACLVQMLPISPGAGSVIDKHNGVLIPLPDGLDNKLGILPQYDRINPDSSDKENPSPFDKGKNPFSEIQKRLEKMEESKERGPGFGHQEGRTKRIKASNKRPRTSNHQKRFGGHIRDLCHRFANSVTEFTPMSASAVVKRQNRGALSVRSFINTQGRRRDIYNKVSRFLKHYALFSIIIDTSGSMQGSAGSHRTKISYTKDAAYSFCDGLAQKKIPFELLTYGSFDNCDPMECWDPIEIIHPIENLSNFSIKERNRLAYIKADGGQSDVLALESSAARLFELAGTFECIPFFLMICDGCTGIELKYAVQKVRKSGGIVVGVGLMLSADEKEEFFINFENNGIIVDDMNLLVPAITHKLIIERNRILLLN